MKMLLTMLLALLAASSAACKLGQREPISGISFQNRSERTVSIGLFVVDSDIRPIRMGTRKAIGQEGSYTYLADGPLPKWVDVNWTYDGETFHQKHINIKALAGTKEPPFGVLTFCFDDPDLFVYLDDLSSPDLSRGRLIFRTSARPDCDAPAKEREQAP